MKKIHIKMLIMLAAPYIFVAMFFIVMIIKESFRTNKNSTDANVVLYSIQETDDIKIYTFRDNLNGLTQFVYPQIKFTHK